MLPVLPIEVLPEYIINTIQDIDDRKSKNKTLSIYTIVVGSYMYEVDIKTLDDKYKRNHEYPQFVKNIFTNLETQISPDMLEYISHFENIIINQHLILIDSMYSSDTNYWGLQNEIPAIIKQGNSILEYDIIHNDYKSTHVLSRLSPVIVASSITQYTIISIIDQITKLCQNKATLINIMDCTSNTLMELFVNNTNPNVYISKPECLLRDGDIEYLPIITFDKTHNIRWMSYNLDHSRIPELKLVIDVCQKSRQALQHLITLYKVRVCNIAFVAIYKMLGMLTITKPYYLPSGKIIAFNELTFNKMQQLWHEPGFIDILIGNFDNYYKANIIHYLTSLILNPPCRVQNNMTFDVILLSDCREIISKLNEYFPEDAIILADGEIRTLRNKLREYMEKNSTYL